MVAVLLLLLDLLALLLVVPPLLALLSVLHQFERESIKPSKGSASELRGSERTE